MMSVLEDTLPFCSIPLTQGKFALVDKDDYEKLSQYKWYAKKGRRTTYYAARSEHIKGEKTCKTVLMHNEILGRKDGFMPDHINHNGLDNRRCNLRFCTRQQNAQNMEPQRNASSKYKGVTFYKNSTTSKKWGARIVISGKGKWLGFFETEIEAAQAYDLAAIEHFGTFAKINEYSREELENGKL